MSKIEINEWYKESKYEGTLVNNDLSSEQPSIRLTTNNIESIATEKIIT